MKAVFTFLAVFAIVMPLRLSATDSSLVVKGTILEKNEIWDRRSNPMMGRPDWLEEIRLKLEVTMVISGELPPGVTQIILSIKEQRMLALNNLAPGDRATFSCIDRDSLYKVVEYYDLEKNARPVHDTKPAPADSIRQQAKPVNYLAKEYLTQVEVNQLLENPDNISGRLIRKFENLRNAALQKIAGQYHLSQAEVLTMVSFSGPMPPEGGYIYWGVTGILNGKWVVWQPGYKGLRDGKALEDPLRYQK